MLLIGYLVVILHFGFFPNAVVLAQTELNFSSTKTILLKRPANFYRLIVDGAPSVCGAILTSLNKEYRFSVKELAGLPRSTVLAERLLSSDLQIDWERKITWRADPDRPAETIDFAHMHIADDANAVGIYRWSFDQPRFFGNAQGVIPADKSKVLSRSNFCDLDTRFSQRVFKAPSADSLPKPRNSRWHVGHVNTSSISRLPVEYKGECRPSSIQQTGQ